MNKQYTCPDCGVVGAGPFGPYFCHICKDRVVMKESHNGKIIKHNNIITNVKKRGE